MSEHLRMDERVKAEDALYESMFKRGDNKNIMIGVGIAAILHLAVLLVHLPERIFQAEEKEKPKIIAVQQYVPPPPKQQRREVAKQEVKKKVPVPDPTPDEPEPIREPEPEIEPEPIPLDVDIEIGDPEPPPPSGPLIAGVQGVSNPVKIEALSPKPEFPEIARRARLMGEVTLQAICYKDGTVGDIQVLRSSRPGVGFEEKAIEAVKQWRYEPATQNGKPVDVFFTIVVNFNLN